MHTYKKEGGKWQVGYYAPVNYFNPIFGPREVKEWQVVTEVEDENQAQLLTSKLNGG